MKRLPRNSVVSGLRLFQIPRAGTKPETVLPRKKRAALSVSLARCGSALALSAFFTAGEVKGATYFWQPTDTGSFSWAGSGNWDLGVVPFGVGEVVNLTSNLTGAQTVNLDRSITVGSLVIGDPDGSAGYTLAGGLVAPGSAGVLTLDVSAGTASIQKLSGANANDLISAAIRFNDSLVVSNESAGTLTLSGALGSTGSDLTLTGSGGIAVSGVISTSGGLTKSGAGTASLTGANTYTGGTGVNGGTLAISNPAALPARSAVTVAAGATLDYVTTATTIGSLSGAGIVTNQGTTATPTLTIGRDDTSTTFNGQFLAPSTKVRMAITKIGAGTLTLAPLTGSSATAAGDFTGTTTLSGGTLALDFGQGTFSGSSMLAATPVTMAGGDLRVVGRSGASIAQTLGGLTLGATGGSITMVPNGGTSTGLQVAGVTATTVGGTLLATVPSGTSVSNTTTGLTNNILGGGRAVFSDGAGAFDWLSQGSATPFQWTGLGTGIGTTPAYTGVLPADGSGVAAGNYTISGSQTQTTAASTIHTLKMTATGAGQALDLATFNLNAAAYLATGTDAYAITGSTGALTAATDLIFHQYNSGGVTIHAPLSGAGALTKAGNGVLTLGSGANAMTGPVNINGGTLSFSSVTAGAAGSLGNGASATVVTIRDGATLRYTGATGTIPATGAGAHTYTLPGGNANIEVTNAASTLTLTGVVSGTGGFTKLGPGGLSMGSAASYTGPTLIQAGTLAVTGDHIPTTSPVTIAAGATLDISATSEQIGSLSGGGAVAAGTTARTFTVGADNTSTTFSGSLTGAATHSLVKTGSGVFTLAGSTTAPWAGNHTVNGGTLRLGADNPLSAASNIILANAANPVLLDLNGFDQTFAQLFFYFNASTSSSRATIQVPQGSTLTSGNISLANSFTSGSVPQNPLGAEVLGQGNLAFTAARVWTVADSASVSADQDELWVSVDLSGPSAITKAGLGTLRLSGSNGFTGAAANTFNAGLTRLDYTTSNTSKLNPSGGLVMGGGGLTLLGNASADTAQTVAGLTVASGDSRMALIPGAGRNLGMALGGITRASGGIIQFDLPSGTQNASQGFSSSAVVDGSGLLGGYATVRTAAGETQFATVAAGNVVGIVPTIQDAVDSWRENQNLSDGSGYTGLLSRSARISSLRFGASGGSTVSIPAGVYLRLESGGVLRTSAAGAGVTSILGGRLLSGSSNEVMATVESAAGFLELGSDISGTTLLTKAGDGTLRLSGTNGSTGGLSLHSGTVQVSGGRALGDESGVVIGASRSNALVLLSDESVGNLTGGVNLVGATSELALGARTLTLLNASGTYSGAISGSGTLIKRGTGTWIYNGLGTSLASGIPFSGTLGVEQGQLDLSGGIFQLPNVAGITVSGPGSVFRNVQDQNNNWDRIADTASVTLNNTAGGLGWFLQKTAGGNASQETVGQLVLNAGQNTVSVTAAASTGMIGAWNFSHATSPLVRNNLSTGLVLGQNLGAGTGIRGRVTFSLQPAGSVGGSGAAGSSTLNIYPFLVGEDTGASAPTAANVGNSLLTFVSTTEGLRPLNLTTEYVVGQTAYDALGSGVLNNNVRFTSSTTTLASDTTGVNALVLDNSAGTLSVTGPSQAHQISSGALLAVGAGAKTIGGYTGLTTAGADNPYYVTVSNATGVLTLNAPLTTATPMVKSGAGTLVLAGTGNAFTDLHLNLGAVQADALEKLGSGSLNFFGGALRWASGSTFDISGRTVTVGTGGAVLDTNGNDISFASAIGNTGAGGLTKNGAGNLTLNAASTFTGASTVNAGRLILDGGANRLPASAGLSLTGSSVLQLGGSSPAEQTLTELVGTATNSIVGGNSGVSTLTLNQERGTSYLGVFGGAGANQNNLALVKNGTGTLILGDVASSFTGGLTVKAGTVIGGNHANTFGDNANVLSIGDTSGSSDATLVVANAHTQPINVVAGSTGVATLVLGNTTASPVVSGAITLAKDLILSKEGTTGTPSVTGGITGTGNLILSNNGTTGTITVSTNPVNHVGSITNSGFATGPTTISSVIGSNVTGVTQNSATSALTLSGSSIGFTGALSVLNGTLNVTGATGTALTPAGITVNGGGTLNLNNGVGQVIQLGSNPLNLGAGSGTATLGFDIGSTADSITSTVAATTANTIRMNITALPGIGAGNYTLLSAASGLDSASAYTWNVAGSPGGFTYTPTVTSTSVSMGVATAASTLYWQQSLDAKWDTFNGTNLNTNWATDLAGTTNAAAIPGSATTVVFSSQAGTIGAPTTTSTLESAFTVNNLVFNNQTNSGAITGITIAPGAAGSLTIAPALSTDGIEVQTGAPSSVTLSAPIALGSNQTWNVADSSSVLASSGGITGAGTGITKTGNGILSLSGTNTYSGTTSISGGVLRAGAANALSSGSALVVGASGTLRLNGFSNTIGSLAGSSGAIVENGASASNAILTAGGDNTSTTFAGTLRDGAAATLGLTKTGSGALILSGANTYTGNTTVSGGTLNITGSLTGNTTTSTLVYGSTAATTVVNVSGDMTLFRTTGGNLNGATAVYNQTAGTVNVTASASSAAFVAGAAGSYGAFNLTGGTYKVSTRFGLGNGTNAATPSTSVVFIGGTGFLDQRSSEWMLNYNNAALTVADSGIVDRTGASQPFGLVMNSTTAGGVYGVLNMAGGSFLTTTSIRFGNSTTAGNGNNNTGIINLAAGTLQVGAAITTSLPADGANNGYLNFAGGTLKMAAGVTNWIPASSGAITFTPTLFGPVNNSAVAGAPSFSGGLTVDTNGFSSSFNNAFLGATGAGVTQSNLVVSGGTGYVGAPLVQFSTAGLVPGGTPAAGYALINGGSVTGIVITSPGTYSAGTVPTVTLTGGGGTGASVAVSALNTANTSGGLTKTGAGTLTLSGNSTFTGPVRIHAGVLAVGSVNDVGTAGPLGMGDNTNAATQAASLVLNGGALSYTGSAPFTYVRPFTLTELGGGISSDNATAANALTIGSATPMVYSGTGARTLRLGGANTGANTLAMALSDTSSDAVTLEKTGAGTWTLTGVNNHTGGTRVSGGTLILGSASVLPAGSAVTVTGGTLDLGANTVNLGLVQVQGGALGASGNTGGVTSSTNYALQSGAVNVALQGTAGINKTGAGTVTLSNGAAGSTFTGPVRVDAGVLAVSRINEVGTAGLLGMGNNTNVATQAASLVLNGGTLSYTGPVRSGTTRAWTLTELGGGLANDNSVAFQSLTIGLTTPIAYSGAGARTLTLGGTQPGTSFETHANVFAAQLTDAPLGAVALTKTGASIWSLTHANNSYSGGTTLNGGILGFAPGALGSTGPVTFAGSATLLWSGTNTTDISSRLVLNNGSTAILHTNGNDLTFASPLTYAGGTNSSLVKSGDGVLSLSVLSSDPASNYSGATVLHRGTLALSGTVGLSGGLTFGSTLGSASSGSLDLSNASATFEGAGLVQSNTTSTIVVGAGRALQINGGLTLANNVNGGTVGLTVSGGGTFGVSGTSMVVGNNTVGTNNSSKAVLDVSGVSAFQVALTGNLVIQQSGDNNSASLATLRLSDTANSIRAAAILVGASSTGAGNAGSTPNQILLGAGTNVLQADLVHLGNGLRDSGWVGFAGAGGTVRLRNAAGTGRSNVTLGVSGVQATGYTTANTWDVTGHAADLAIGTLTTSPGQKTAVNTNLFRFDQGTLDILHTNLGLQTGAGLSTNRLSIGGGTVLLGGSAAFGDAGAGSVVLATAAGGELEITGGTVTTSVDITRAGAGTALITLNGGVLEMAGKNIGSATNPVLVAGGGGVLRNVGEINGGTGITLGGTGRALILAGTNTYSGTTTVAAGGAVSFATVSAKSPNSPVTAGTGSGVALGVKPGDAAYFGAADVDSLFAGTLSGVTLSAGGLVGIDTSAGDFSYSSSIASTNLGLAKVGAGVLTLTGTNAYTGDTRIFGGTLVATHPQALGDTASALILEAGTELQLSSDSSILAHNTTVRGNASMVSGRATAGAGITHGMGTLSIGPATLAVRPGASVTAGTAYGLSFGATTLTGDTVWDVSNNGAGVGTVSVGAVSGGFGISKTGNGLLQLNGASTYSGATGVDSGTLQLGAGASINAATVVTLANGNASATFDVNGATAAINALNFGGANGGSGSQGTVNIGIGGTLTLGGNVTTVATGDSIATHRIQGGTLNLGAATRTFTVADSAGVGTELEVTSVIAGSVGVTKAGPGSLRLSGNNTFTGNVTFTGTVGPLVVGHSGGLGTGPKTVSIIGGPGVSSHALHLDGSAGSIVIPADISFTTSSATGQGGIVNLAGENTILGNFTLTTGGGSTQFTVNGGTLTVGSASSALTPDVTARQVFLNGVGNGYVNGLVRDGSGSFLLGLQKLGAGEWTLTNANTFSSGTVVLGGSLRLAGGDNRLLTTGRVTLGDAATGASGQLILGGDPDGAGAGVSAVSHQTFSQTSTTGILTTAGAGTSNAVVGGHLGSGTSAGNAAGNSALTLQIGAGFTNTYAGLFGWDGAGSVGAQNNLNVIKSGAGVLEIAADLSRWTGIQTGAGPNLSSLAADPTRPELQITGGVLRLASTSVINTVVRNTGGVLDNQGATLGNNFLLVTSGGLVTLSRPTDTLGAVGLNADATGVAALQSAPNAALQSYLGSQMYLGAVGARVLTSTSLTPGAGSLYRLGGGAPVGRLDLASSTGSGGYLQVAGTNVLTGTAGLVVGDNGTYAGGLLGARSTVEIAGAQDYTGTTTLAGGTLVVSHAGALGVPATTAGSVILDGGSLRYNGINTDFSPRLTIGSGGTIDTGGQTVTFASAIGNSATGTSGLGNGGLTKNGTGTLILTALNTYAGSTTVNNGTLQLNGQTGGLTSGLNFGGPGTFQFENVGATGALSASLGALSFSAGDGVILSQRTAAQSTTLTFSALPTRSAGATGNFTVSGTGSSAVVNKAVFSSAPSTGQFLNSGLYFGGTDFAAYDAAGYVRALATTDSNSSAVGAGATLGTVTGRNVFLTGAISAQTSLSIQSLKMSNVNLAVGSGQTLTLSSGGLIKTGANTTISGGTLSANNGTNPVELVVRTSASTDALTISSTINAQGLTKSGAGTLTLSTSTNVLNGGAVTINGGTISVDTEARLGGYSGVVLNGGALTVSGNSTVTGPFTLGLGGGTLSQTSTAQNNDMGVAGQSLLFLGEGARTLTLIGAANRQKNFLFSVGDNGGPTSLVLGSDSNHVIRLAGANTYTGSTTINQGILRVDAATQIPGGLGSLLNSGRGAGGGNFVFAASGTNRAILEISSAMEGVFRSVGTGPGQIQWTGNGGFSVNTAGATLPVNLGGTGALLTWGSGGFVPDGARLQFSQAASNVGAAGLVDFQNPIHFGSQVRTIDVSPISGRAVDAILSGNLTFDAGGGISKTTGTGELLLTGINNVGVATVDVTAGSLLFGSASSVPGSSGAITVTSGATSFAAIGVVGVTNPVSFFDARLAPGSSGTLLLANSSSDVLDFSVGNATNMRLGGLNPVTVSPVVFTGSIVPSGTTYRLGGTNFLNGSEAPRASLVLARQDILNGARSLDLAPGNVTITAPQSYSGGTGLNTSVAGNIVAVGVGSDAAFGTGTVTTGGGTSIYLGAVNGDRVVPNRVVHGGTVALVMSSDTASDGIANNTNQGAMTYLGTLDLNLRATATPLWARGNHAALLLGDISNSTNGISLNGTPIFSILSTPANGGTPKTFSGAVTLADTANLVIDGDSALGVSGGITLGTSILQVQPGTQGAVTLGSSRILTVTADKAPTVIVPESASLVLTAAINSTGGNAGARSLTKSGAGTLVLRGANGTYGGAASNTNSLAVRGGTLRMESANFTAGTDRFFPDASNPLPLEFGVASGNIGGNPVVELVHASDKAFALSQGFGNVLVNYGAGTLRLNNQNATQALTLNLGATLTRSAGATLNFVSTTAGGLNTINSTAANTNGILGGWATFGGLDWATQTAGAIGAFSAYTAPLPASGATATANYLLAGNVTVTTSQTVNSLKLAPTASQTLSINSGQVLNNSSGGILMDNSQASSLITGAGQLGTTGSELMVTVNGSNPSNKLTINGVVKGSGTALTKSGSGTLVLSGANTYTGSLVIHSGVVEFSNPTGGQNLGNPSASATNIQLNGGTLRYTGTTTSTLGLGIAVNSASVLDIPNAEGILVHSPTGFGLSGVASQLVTGTLQKTGLGTLTLAGATANSALSVSVTGGALELAKTGVVAVGETTNVIGVPFAALLVGNGALARLTGTGGNQIGNASSVVVRTGGVFDLNGNAATTAVSEAFDGLAGGGQVRNFGPDLFTLSVGSNNSSSLAPRTLGAAAAGVSETGLNHFSGNILDAIALTKIGSGTQVLSGSNSYIGDTTIQAGTLRMAGTNVLPSGAGKGNVNLVGDATGVALGGSATIQAPGTLDLGGYNQSINALNSTTGGIITNNPALTHDPTANSGAGAWVVAAAVQGAKTLTLGNNNASGAFNGIIQDGYSVAPGAIATGYVGTVDLAKTGAGTQTLAGANTYSGSTLVSGGALRITHNSGLGSIAAGTTVADGAALELGGGVAVGLESLSLSGNGIANGGALRSVSGTNTYGGALTLAADSRIHADAGSLEVSNSVNGAFALTVGGAGNTTLSGTLNVASLTKEGSGTLMLPGSGGTLTGALTASGGELRLTSSLSGVTALNVNNGGTLLLGGSSTNRISDTAPVSLGSATSGALGFLSGVSSASETLGALTLSLDSVIDFGAGTGNTLTFASLTLNPNFTSLKVYNWSRSFFEPGTTTDPGTDANQDRLLFTQFTGVTAGQLGQITFYSDNGLTPIGGATQITFGPGGQAELVPVPEPSTWMAGGLLLGLLGYRERRRLRTLLARG